MSAATLLPIDDDGTTTVTKPIFRMPESPVYHNDDDGAAVEDVGKVFIDTPPHAAVEPMVEQPKRSTTAQKQPRAPAKKPVVAEAAPAIAAQRKNQTPSAKRSAAAELAADQDATQSVERHPQKKQKGKSSDVVAASKPAPSAKAATKNASGGAAESKTKDAVKPKEAEVDKKAAAAKKKKDKKTTTRKPRISFTQQSRQPGKRAVGDKRPRRAVALIDDEAEDDDEEDEDFDEEVAAAAAEEDDDDDEDDEDEVVNNEGGLAEVDDEEDDDNATVAISNPRNEDDDDDEEEVEDAKLMSSTRPRSRANVVRGDPNLAAARRIAAIEFDSESDAEAVAAAAGAAPSKGKRKKATDGESVATVEKRAAAKSKRRAVEMESVANSDTDFDMDAVLRKNAKKFKLVPEKDGAELSTTNVRKHVERKLRGAGESTKMVYRLLHLNATRRCAYTKAELMKPNTEKPLRIDMFNFLHFAAVVNGKYKMEDVMSFLVDKNGMMCACPRRVLLALLYLDHGRNYAQFRVFYDNLSTYIDLNNEDKVPPVPPALYTSGEIRKAKPLCPTIDKMSKWTQSSGGGGVGDDDDDDAAAATEMQSVVPATEFDGDDARSVATSKHPKAAASSRRSRATARPPATSASTSFGVYTNVDLANPAYRGLNLVSRSYGAGTQLPLATFIGNPMARLVLEFGPMCPTEQHAVYFAHVIRSQLVANGPVIDEMIRDVSRPPPAAAAAAAAAAPEQDE